MSVREQVAAQMVFLIGIGQLKPGDRLPSVRELARRLRVHRNTISHAYNDPMLTGLIEKAAGSRVRVRASDVADSAHPGLDALINEAILAAQRQGYTLQQLGERVLERLRLEPPDHVLAVDGEVGMRVVMRVELRRRFDCAIDVCTPTDLQSDRKRALGAVVLCPVGLVGEVDRLLPTERPAMRIVYSSVEPHLARIRRLSGPSVIALVTVSQVLLDMARALLAPAIGRRHSLEEYLMNDDGTQAPRNADLLFCDAVTYRLLRPRHDPVKVVPYALFSPEFLDSVEAALPTRTEARS